MAAQKLISLLDVTHIKTKSFFVDDLASSLDIKSWRDHPGVERWELVLPKELKSNADIIVDICENGFGINKEVLPKEDVDYSGVLFLGATLSRVIDRAEFYKILVKEGAIKKDLKVWVLTGERELNERAGETKENFQKLVLQDKKPLPLPSNEFEMIEFVFHYVMPKDIEVEYIYSKKDPNYTRATTYSTVSFWIDNHLDNSSDKRYFLAISNQPHVFYQELVANSSVKKSGKDNVHVHAIGNKGKKYADPDNYAAILLSTVSKIISKCGEM